MIKSFFKDLFNNAEKEKATMPTTKALPEGVVKSLVPEEPITKPVVPEETKYQEMTPEETIKATEYLRKAK